MNHSEENFSNISKNLRDTKDNVIKNLNKVRNTKLIQSRMAESLGLGPTMAVCATAGLGFYLLSRSLQSKKYYQG